MREKKEFGYIPINSMVKSGTVSKKADRYYVSILVEERDIKISNTNNEGLGIDLGIKEFVVCSDGISNFKDETINIRNVRIEEVNDLGDEYVVNGDFETNTTSGWNTYNSNGSNLKINAVNQNSVYLNI